MDDIIQAVGDIPKEPKNGGDFNVEVEWSMYFLGSSFSLYRGVLMYGCMTCAQCIIG